MLTGTNLLAIVSWGFARLRSDQEPLLSPLFRPDALGMPGRVRFDQPWSLPLRDFRWNDPAGRFREYPIQGVNAMKTLLAKLVGGGALLAALAFTGPKAADAQIVIGGRGQNWNQGWGGTHRGGSNWSSGYRGGHHNPGYGNYYRSDYGHRYQGHQRGFYGNQQYYGSPYYGGGFYRGNAAQIGPVQIYWR